MRIFIVGFVIVFAFSICYAQSNSCDIRWDSIMQISNTGQIAYAPQIISTGDTIHITWVGDNARHIFYNHSFDGGKTFSSQGELVNPDSSNGGIMAISGSSVYVTYTARVDSPIWWETAILRSTDAGMTWQPRQILGDYNIWTIAARDSHVYVYIGYQENNKLWGV